jgi:hypothetical protein
MDESRVRFPYPPPKKLQMRLKINFTDGHFILVHLHETVNKWASHVKQISNKYQFSLNKGRSAIGTGEIKENKGQAAYKILLDTVEKLKNIRPIGFDIPETFSSDQDLLNRLHRYYTESASEIDTKSELFKLVSKINYCVHELEEFTPSDNPTYVSDLWFHVDDYPIPMDCWIDLDDQQQENYKFFDYDYDYTVRLDRSILGKCVLQAFVEDDDPNARDCTGRLGSFGGFFIDTNKKLKELYESDRFTKWCRRHGKQPREFPLEFVIGKVQQFSDEPGEYKNKILAGLNFEVP